MNKRTFAILAILIAAGTSLFGWLGWRQGQPTAASSLSTTSGRQITIEITSDPTGASVSIDGRHHGTTPIIIELLADRTYEYRLLPAEPYTDYRLYKPFIGTFRTDEDKAISVWLDRTTAEEQQQQRAQAEASRAQQALEQCQRRRASVELIIDNWGWRNSSDRYVTAEGRVVNNTNRTIEYARVLIEYTTSSGQFITSDWGYLELTALLPGQASPFRIITNSNPAMSRASIRFLDRSQRVIPAANRADIEC